jgi:hypothetical protein
MYKNLARNVEVRRTEEDIWDQIVEDIESQKEATNGTPLKVE